MSVCSVECVWRIVRAANTRILGFCFRGASATERSDINRQLTLSSEIHTRTYRRHRGREAEPPLRLCDITGIANAIAGRHRHRLHRVHAARSDPVTRSSKNQNGARGLKRGTPDETQSQKLKNRRDVLKHEPQRDQDVSSLAGARHAGVGEEGNPAPEERGGQQSFSDGCEDVPVSTLTWALEPHGQ